MFAPDKWGPSHSERNERSSSQARDGQNGLGKVRGFLFCFAPSVRREGGREKGRGDAVTAAYAAAKPGRQVVVVVGSGSREERKQEQNAAVAAPCMWMQP